MWFLALYIFAKLFWRACKTLAKQLPGAEARIFQVNQGRFHGYWCSVSWHCQLVSSLGSARLMGLFLLWKCSTSGTCIISVSKRIGNTNMHLCFHKFDWSQMNTYVAIYFEQFNIFVCNLNIIGVRIANCVDVSYNYWYLVLIVGIDYTGKMASWYWNYHLITWQRYMVLIYNHLNIVLSFVQNNSACEILMCFSLLGAIWYVMHLGGFMVSVSNSKHHQVLTLLEYIILMPWHKTAVTPLLTRWRHCSLTLIHHMRWRSISHKICTQFCDALLKCLQSFRWLSARLQ